MFINFIWTVQQQTVDSSWRFRIFVKLIGFTLKFPLSVPNSVREREKNRITESGWTLFQRCQIRWFVYQVQPVISIGDPERIAVISECWDNLSNGFSILFYGVDIKTMRIPCFCQLNTKFAPSFFLYQSLRVSLKVRKRHKLSQ